MSKEWYYIRFRIKQLTRVVNQDVDKFFFFLVFAGVVLFYNLPEELYGVAYFVVPSLMYQLERKDIAFLRKVFGRRAYALMWVESCLIYLVVALLMLCKINSPNVFIIGFLLCFIYPLISVEKFEWTKSINLSFVPEDAFEWKTYIRQKPFHFIMAFIGFVIALFHPALLGVMSFLFCGNINAVYETTEPREVYKAYFGRKTIDEKLYHTTLFVVKMVLPFFVISTLLHPSLFYIIIIIFFFLVLFLVNIILLKYAEYEQSYKRLKTINMAQVLKIVFSIFLIFPWVYNCISLRKKIIKEIRLNVRG